MHGCVPRLGVLTRERVSVCVTLKNTWDRSQAPKLADFGWGQVPVRSDPALPELQVCDILFTTSTHRPSLPLHLILYEAT